MFDASSPKIHLLPLNDLKYGRRRAKYQRRTVTTVEFGAGASDHIAVADGDRRPLVWIGAPLDLALKPGDSVWALWFEGYVQGWGPIAKTVCHDSTCERALYVVNADGALRSVAHIGATHFWVERA
ncbi:hypothetical protein [Demequina oxidasica]|uniref:hypothetical protein n=1 Tax=Demequina oxidasica TaxID=676199 RepID=UPI0007811D95|nr:hypothetical protein [Demequina oxidasica]